MGLFKLISNRISTEWKEKFNKNVDYLNSLETKLSDQDKATNSRINNLVLHSGGDSPNEVVDGRVDYKGQAYSVLQDRLLASEQLSQSIPMPRSVSAPVSSNIIPNRCQPSRRKHWISLYRRNPV